MSFRESIKLGFVASPVNVIIVKIVITLIVHLILSLNGKSEELKSQALELDLEGLGFRSIGRILKVSHVSVYRWIKSYGMKAKFLSNRDKVDIVEIDEMHTYIGNKENIVRSVLQ